jgi:hypothetical protein
MTDSAVLVLRFRSLRYLSNSEIRSLLSMGASKFFDICGSACAQNLHPTLRTARGDTHGRVAWTKKSVKFVACEVSAVNRQNVSLQISIVRTVFLLAAPSSREKLSECSHSDIMIMLYGVMLILGCHLCDCHTRLLGQRHRLVTRATPRRRSDGRLVKPGKAAEFGIRLACEATGSTNFCRITSYSAAASPPRERNRGRAAPRD